METADVAVPAAPAAGGVNVVGKQLGWVWWTYIRFQVAIACRARTHLLADRTLLIYDTYLILRRLRFECARGNIETTVEIGSPATGSGATFSDVYQLSNTLISLKMLRTDVLLRTRTYPYTDIESVTYRSNIYNKNLSTIVRLPSLNENMRIWGRKKNKVIP